MIPPAPIMACRSGENQRREAMLPAYNERLSRLRHVAGQFELCQEILGRGEVKFRSQSADMRHRDRFALASGQVVDQSIMGSVQEVGHIPLMFEQEHLISLEKSNGSALVGRHKPAIGTLSFELAHPIHAGPLHKSPTRSAAQFARQDGLGIFGSKFLHSALCREYALLMPGVAAAEALQLALPRGRRNQAEALEAQEEAAVLPDQALSAINC